MATTYDKASLVMIPSGYKDDKLYSVKPTDGSGDFTFSRDGAGASPATRVNASGLIEKGRTNELLYSNDFSNAAWSKTGGPVLTSGQADPFGGSNAWKFESSSAISTQIFQSQNYILGSMYAKAGNVSTFSLWANLAVTFDLSSGTITSGASNGSIEDVGGGWYRLSIFNPSGANVFNPNFTATASGEFVYIAFSQAEYSLVATDYIETTTAPVSAGLLGDMPRLDYSGGATCGSLLLEPSRANLIVQSEYFGSNWNNNNLTITPNATTSPEGLNNASLLTSNNPTGGVYRIYEDSSAAGQAIGTASVFMKYVNNQYAYLAQDNYSGITRYAVFDLINGTNTYVTSGYTATITPYADGWYRCTITGEQNTQSYIQIGLSNADNAYTGNIANGQSVYFWGVQREYNSSYVSSYIPTYGSASTRGADSCVDGGDANTFNDSEGVLYAEISALANDLSNRLISLTNGTSTERISLFYSQDSSNEVKGIIFVGGVVTGEVEYNVPDITANIKVALKYKANDFALWINGVEVATDLSGAVPSGLDRLNFDLGISGSILPFFGNVKQTIYFPTALTDAELAALTTL